jgi:hypothetical protein
MEDLPGVGRELSLGHTKACIPRVLLVPFYVGRLPFVGEISMSIVCASIRVDNGGVRAPERVLPGKGV